MVAHPLKAQRAPRRSRWSLLAYRPQLVEVGIDLGVHALRRYRPLITGEADPKDREHERRPFPIKQAQSRLVERFAQPCELTTKVGLSERLKHRPSELSGGQQQRVAIARALVGRPTVMFADEPTGNLDSTTGGEILDLLRDSVTSLGQTTVMVTHDAHAAAIADRVLFLADGLIVKDLGPSTSHEVIAAMEEVTAR